MSGDITKWSSSDVFDRIMSPGGTPEEMLKLYEEIVRRDEFYREDRVETYKGPTFIAEWLADLISENRSNVRILDVGAGSGNVAIKLRQYGFENIDALDPSAAMLSRAKKDNLYQNYICEFVTDKQMDLSEGSYDIVVMSGAFTGGHMPCVALYEMVRLLRKGGYCCFVIQERYLEMVQEYRGLEEMIARLEKEGEWEKIERRVYPDYLPGRSGVLYSYRKI